MTLPLLAEKTRYLKENPKEVSEVCKQIYGGYGHPKSHSFEKTIHHENEEQNANIFSSIVSSWGIMGRLALCISRILLGRTEGVSRCTAVLLLSTEGREADFGSLGRWKLCDCVGHWG